MHRRLALTVVLSLLLISLGLAAPASGAAPAAPPRVETLDGLGGSQPVEAPFPFSMVGLTLPAGASAELRTSADGKVWSEWREVDLEAPATTSEPLWVGEARYLQTRVEGATPDAVAVHLVDSAGLSRSLGERLGDAVRSAWSGAPQPAMAAVDGPPIRSRAEWGAREPRSPASYARRVRLGFLHHTADASDYGPEDVPAIVRGSQAYHMDVRGWEDIGYNLLIDRFGTIWEGRAGGLDSTVIGAHTGGFNTGSFGVSLIGDFTQGSPTSATVDALVRLMAWKYDLYHVDVLSEVDVRSGGTNRYPPGETVRLSTLSAHRDVTLTTCPASAADLLPALRPRIAEAQGAVLLDHAAAPDGVRLVEGASLDGPLTFSTRLRPAGDWRLEVRDPAGVVVHTAAGSGEVASSTWVPSGAARGDHTYTFSADGRRPATDVVELRSPDVDVAIPESVRAGDGGGTAEPVRIAAQLWPGADWTATITGPDGQAAFAAQGTGEQLDVAWDGTGAEPGTYRYTVAADDVEPVRGELRVVREALRRVAAAGDPVADAVELSATAFPDDGTARSAVLARADVFADAMAGGPLAGEDGPVLLTGSAALDDRVRDELERVLPDSGTVYVLGGPEALAPEVEQAVAGTWRVVRLGGAERTETAALVAGAVVERTGASSALVARADGGFAPWADALAGGAWGADRGVPVLLTDTAAVSPAARDALTDLGIAETIVLGGTAAVSADVEAALPGARRVWGADRAGTAAAIAQQLWEVGAGTDGDRLLLAEAYREDAWTLPLAASPLAALQDAPLYVTEHAALPAATAEALRALGYAPDRAASGYVLGGDDRVAPAVAEEVGALLG